MPQFHQLICRERQLIYAAILAIWLGILLFSALTPSFPRMPFIQDAYLGPVGHVAMHFVLTVLLCILLMSNGLKTFGTRQSLLIASASSLFFGLALEGMQLTVATRSTTLLDVFYNTIGVLAAVIVVIGFSILKSIQPKH